MAVLLALVMVVIVPYSMMTPIFVIRLFGKAQWMLASTEILWSLGMVVGGVILAAWGGFKNRMTTVMISGITMAILTMAMGFAPNLWVFLVIMVISGITLPLWTTPAMTSAQEYVPEHMLGRFSSFIILINTVSGPVGIAIIGPLADRFDISWMAFVCGAVTLAILIVLVVRGGPGSKLMAPEKELSATI
jgi:DHA3 family macrolide efflux protein-like MFS transporter